MVRRKKSKDGWNVFDNFEDFQDSLNDRGDDTDSGAAVPEVEKISLRDFVIPEKVSAFVHTYEPCDEFDAGAERFDDARLREYFKAYVCGLGDPLALYLEDLKLAPEPFRMATSLATGTPCLFCKLKI